MLKLWMEKIGTNNPKHYLKLKQIINGGPWSSLDSVSNTQIRRRPAVCGGRKPVTRVRIPAGPPSYRSDKLISKEFLHFKRGKMAEAVVKVTSKGQLTLPAGIRDDLNIGKGDYLYVTEAGGLILMKRICVDPKEILNAFQRAAKEVGLTRKELNRAIQEIRRAKG